MTESLFPILDIHNKTSNISKDLIEKVRQQFLERVNKDPELYYKEDVERVKTDDWTVRRFLYRFNEVPDVNKGVEALNKAMKWRKLFGVLDFKDSDLAKEVCLSAGIIIYGKDLNGCQLMITRSKVSKKLNTLRPYMDRVLVHYLEKVDRDNKGKGLTFVNDSRDTGLNNLDKNAMKFYHTLTEEYYPGLVNATVVYKMSPVSEAYKLFKSWFNEEQNKYIYLFDKKNLNNYVSADQLPDFLFGDNIEPYRVVPEGATNLYEVADKYGIKKEKTDKLLKHFEKLYENLFFI